MNLSSIVASLASFGQFRGSNQPTAEDQQHNAIMEASDLENSTSTGLAMDLSNDADVAVFIYAFGALSDVCLRLTTVQVMTNSGPPRVGQRTVHHN